jgi:hypothetical protein
MSPPAVHARNHSRATDPVQAVGRRLSGVIRSSVRRPRSKNPPLGGFLAFGAGVGHPSAIGTAWAAASLDSTRANAEMFWAN